jgi:oxygen-independent coproporphyrinogen-3 oxidase
LAGIYIHIPFCKQACNYCDFHFSTNLNPRVEMIESIVLELKQRKNYLANESIDSIYLGGGTPSLLNEYEIQSIINTIHKEFQVNTSIEVTLEANPDDITVDKIREFKNNGINRLSIGIQSFDNANLKFMNRAHNAEEAEQCVKLAQDGGITNLTIDLIYGIPSADHNNLQNDLKKAFQLNTNHISAYSLTIEDKTTFGVNVKKGKMKPIDEEFAAQQYEIMSNAMELNGFEQYEISNFAKNRSYAVHNSNYWKQKPYLGVGPGAHSYNTLSRSYNISNNNKYIQSFVNGSKRSTEEFLSINDKTNEYILTTLRTKWGCDLKFIDELNPNFIKLHKGTIEKLISLNLITVQNQILYLSKEGRIIADKITEEFFII